jgi:hypothetical protein
MAPLPPRAPLPYNRRNLKKKLRALKRHGRNMVRCQAILDQMDEATPERLRDFIEHLRQREHALGIQTSIGYALNLAVALEAGYRVPAYGLGPSDVYIDLAVVLDRAYRARRRAGLIPGRGIHNAVAWLLYHHALQMLVLIIPMGL